MYSATRMIRTMKIEQRSQLMASAACCIMFSMSCLLSVVSMSATFRSSIVLEKRCACSSRSMALATEREKGGQWRWGWGSRGVMTASKEGGLVEDAAQWGWKED